MSTIEDVREFWNANPCGSRLSRERELDRWFEDHRRLRYDAEPHIHEVARFADFAGKDVLEIGCGIGADGLEFARNGARYMGVDLTPKAVETARTRFARAGLPGRFDVANAERLPFASGSFEHVYSFGVIHHSPRTDVIVDEILRVLRPGGTICVMVYNRTSINYRVEIQGLRKLARYALVPRGSPRLISGLTGIEAEKLERHRQIFLSGPRLSKQAWISMNTDGPDCPLAKVYDAREAARLFQGFADVEQEVWYFDRRHWPVVGPRMPDGLARSLGRRWGWHRVVRARKPA